MVHYYIEKKPSISHHSCRYIRWNIGKRFCSIKGNENFFSPSQLTTADEVEVVKAVSPDDAAEINDTDQVALESIDSDASPSIHLPLSQPAG